MNLPLPPQVREALERGLLSEEDVQLAWQRAKALSDRRGDLEVDPTDLLLEIQILQEKEPLPVPKVPKPKSPQAHLRDLDFPPYEDWEFGGTRSTRRISSTEESEDDIQVNFSLAARSLISLGAITGDQVRVRDTYQSLTEFLARIGMKKFLKIEAVVSALSSFTARELRILQNGIRIELEKRM